MWSHRRNLPRGWNWSWVKVGDRRRVVGYSSEYSSAYRRLFVGVLSAYLVGVFVGVSSACWLGCWSEYIGVSVGVFVRGIRRVSVGVFVGVLSGVRRGIRRSICGVFVGVSVGDWSGVRRGGGVLSACRLGLVGVSVAYWRRVGWWLLEVRRRLVACRWVLVGVPSAYSSGIGRRLVGVSVAVFVGVLVGVSVAVFVGVGGLQACTQPVPGRSVSAGAGRVGMVGRQTGENGTAAGVEAPVYDGGVVQEVRVTVPGSGVPCPAPPSALSSPGETR